MSSSSSPVPLLMYPQVLLHVFSVLYMSFIECDQSSHLCYSDDVGLWYILFHVLSVYTEISFYSGRHTSAVMSLVRTYLGSLLFPGMTAAQF